MANEEYSQVLTKDNEGFFRFIESKMKGNGITTEQLTSGLCDMEEWNNLLSGEYMDKLMMSRLLDRLGCRGLRCDILCSLLSMMTGRSVWMLYLPSMMAGQSLQKKYWKNMLAEKSYKKY